MFKFQQQNGRKRKNEKRIFRVQNGAIRGLKIRAGFWDFKSGQERLQIGTALGISNRGKKITNRGRGISNWGRYYKLVQNSDCKLLLKATLIFNSASVLLNFFMNLASYVAQVLLNTYNHHYTETHFISRIFVSMPRPKSIYIVSM